MARMARVVVPGIPHHVTQRGNRRQKVFFMDSDHQHYKELLSEFCIKAQNKRVGVLLDAQSRSPCSGSER